MKTKFLHLQSCLALMVGLSAGTSSIDYAHAADRSLLEVVRGYADTMIENGSDNIGPQKTPLLLSALDRENLQPLTTRPAAPVGIRKGDRVATSTGPLHGCNPQHHENLLRVLYVLSEITGDPRYRQAADEELAWFFRNARSSQTNLLAWGEHLFWDPIQDGPASEHAEPVHEFFRPWVLWDRSFALAPEECKQFAIALWEHQIADHLTGAFDRHAAFLKHAPADNLDFPRHGGFFIATWAAAYKHTQDETFIKPIETLLARFKNKRHPKTGFINIAGEDPAGAPMLSLAIDCSSAADQLSGTLADKLRGFAEREDNLFLSLPHKPASTGFITVVRRETGEPDSSTRWGPAETTQWQSAYGGNTTAMIALLCGQRYEQTNTTKYRDLLYAAADGYLESSPPADADTWPMAVGHVISVEMTAYRWTGKDIYLKRARELAQFAVSTFWQDSPIPRASTKTNHYEAITGADSLALALLEVYAMDRHLPVRIPANTIDR